MVISYHGSRHWAFRDRQARHADGGRRGVRRHQPAHDADPDRLPVDQPQRARPRRPDLRQHLGQRDRAGARPTPPGSSCSGTFVFQRPISIVEIYDEPGLLEDLELLDERRGPVSESPACRQRSVHERPSSAISSRSSGRLSPTTLWWSPSIAGHERAAEAVDGEGAGDVQRLAGRDVRRDLVVGDVGEVHGGGRRWPRRRGRSRCRAGSGRCRSTPERPRIARHRRVASAGVAGLAERLAVELEHRVAAEHERGFGAGRRARRRRRT